MPDPHKHQIFTRWIDWVHCYVVPKEFATEYYPGVRWVACTKQSAYLRLMDVPNPVQRHNRTNVAEVKKRLEGESFAQGRPMCGTYTNGQLHARNTGMIIWATLHGCVCTSYQSQADGCNIHTMTERQKQVMLARFSQRLRFAEDNNKGFGYIKNFVNPDRDEEMYGWEVENNLWVYPDDLPRFNLYGFDRDNSCLDEDTDDDGDRICHDDDDGGNEITIGSFPYSELRFAITAFNGLNGYIQVDSQCGGHIHCNINSVRVLHRAYLLHKWIWDMSEDCREAIFGRGYGEYRKGYRYDSFGHFMRQARKSDGMYAAVAIRPEYHTVEVRLFSGSSRSEVWEARTRFLHDWLYGNDSVSIVAEKVINASYDLEVAYN